MEHVKADEFDSKVLGNSRKMVVLFYATWCPYCANFKPTFESAKTNAADKLAAIID